MLRSLVNAVTGGSALSRGPRRKPRAATSRRLARVEPLEDRRVLATFLVINAGDGIVDFNNSQPGTLRQAIYDAKQFDDGPDVIQFALPAGQDTITLNSGELLIDESLQIDGPGWDQLTIDGSMQAGDGIFSITLSGGEDVILKGLSLTEGSRSRGGAIDASIGVNASLILEQLRAYENQADTLGGAIYVSIDKTTSSNAGELTIDNVIVDDNHASLDGGGLYLANKGLVTIDRLVARTNTAITEGIITYGGGLAIAAASGDTLIRDSLFADNTAGYTDDQSRVDFYGRSVSIGYGKGGGIAVVDFGEPGSNVNLLLDSVALISNVAYGQGGGLYAGRTDFDELDIVNSLVYRNRAQQGGGLWLPEGDIRHSTVFQNTAGHGGLHGPGGGGGGGPAPDWTVAGGGVYSLNTDMSFSSAVSFDSSIIYGNAFDGDMGVESLFPDPDNPSVDIEVPYLSRPRFGADIAQHDGGFGYDRTIENPDVDPFVVLSQIQFSIDAKYSIFGSVDDAAPNQSFLQGGPWAWNGLTTTDIVIGIGADNPLISPPNLGIASELSYAGDTTFLDGSTMPVLPLLPGSQAIDTGNPVYDESTGNTPEYTFDGMMIPVDTDLRGDQYDRLADRIDIGSYEFQDDPAAGPRVTNVVVTSTGGDVRDFRSIEQTLASLTVNGSPLNFNHLSALLLDNVETVQIEFSEPIATPQPDALKIALIDDPGETIGVETVTASSVSHTPGSNTATWTLPSAITEGKYILRLESGADGVETPAGAALDGDWLNPQKSDSDDASVSSFLTGGSGDGMVDPNDDFLFAFNLAPGLLGDADFDNDVDGDDLIAVQTNFGDIGEIFAFLGDADQDGDVDGDDLIAVQTSFGNIGPVFDLWGIHRRADYDAVLGVDENDKPLFDALFLAGDLQADLNGDGNVDAVDEALFEYFRDLQFGAA